MTGDTLFGPVAAPGLHVMTYNIRRRISPNPRPADRWATRAPLLRTLLQDEQPTLLGVQEAMPRQADAVSAALGPRWRRVGHGRRADGQGEGCPLFFDGDRLELRGWSQLALSDRPGVAGSRTWGNLLPRMRVRAEFRDRVTGAMFVAVNTHLDPFSARSRVRSAEVLRALAAAETFPTVVMGDLNSRPDSPPMRTLFAAGTLRDAWAVAERRVGEEWDTLADYRTPRKTGRRIDWIAVTSDVRVAQIGVNTRTVSGRWPSDHLPVQAILIPGGTNGPEAGSP